MRLLLDERIGARNTDQYFEGIDEKTSLEKLSLLDGDKHTLIMLERSDGWQLMAGGGPAKFIVTLSDGSENLTLINTFGDDSVTVELCAGGQLGEFPENLCVDYEQAKNAIQLFFKNTERSAGWM